MFDVWPWSWPDEGGASDPNNSRLQVEVFRSNIAFMLNDLMTNYSGVIQSFKFWNLLRRNNEANTLWSWANLQIDIASLYVLIDYWYDFTNLSNNLIELSWNETWAWMRYTDFYKIAQDFIRKKSEDTATDMCFPKMVEDAIESNRWSWELPLAKDMQKAVIYVSGRASSILNPNRAL